MNGYFQPLRRKFGILTLAVASVALAGWVRSISTLDLVILAGKSSNRILVSGSQKFRIIDANQYRLAETLVQQESTLEEPASQLRKTNSSPPRGGSPGKPPVAAHYFHTKVIPVASFIGYPHYINWHSRPATKVGIYGSYKDSQPLVEMIPYWTIALPLTLLSAWLLISKPRPVKPVH